MRTMILSAALGVLLVAGCEKESPTPAPAGPSATPAARPPSPSTVEKTRGPNNDKQDILGVWQTKGDEAKGEAPVQFEFAENELTIRKGPGPNWTETAKVPYTLRNELLPSQIDWGNGAEGGYGLYTLDGDNLYIDYQTGGPQNRPKKLGRPTTAIQHELQRVK